MISAGAVPIRSLSRRNLSVWACLLLLFLLLFWLPYHVPLAPSVSDSYMAGYNNRAAVVLVFLGAVLAGWFLPQPARESRPGKPLQRSTLLKALSGILLLSLAIFFYVDRLDGFNESVYTIDRVQLMLAGKLPYRDFEFAYGPLLLYAPLCLLHVFPLSVPQACDLFWLVLNGLGVLELYQIVRWTEMPRAAQRQVFLLVLLCGVPALLSTGSAYTLPRFLTPLFCAMALQQVLCRSPSATHRAAMLPLLVLLTVLTLSLSPEMGLAFAAGMFLYCLRYLQPRDARYTAAVAGTAVLLGLLLWATARCGVFSTLSAFSAGGLNFPLTPGPYLLLFLASLGVTATYMAARLRAGEDTPLLASCVVAAAIVPGALGRCDAGHLLLDGIGILLCALLVCAAGRPKARLLLLFTLLLHVVYPLVVGSRPLASLYIGPALALLTNSGNPRSAHWAEVLSIRLYGAAKGRQRLEEMRATRTTGQPDDLQQVFDVPSSTVFDVPFLFSGGHWGPYHSTQLDQGYYLGTLNLVSAQGVARKTAELVEHPDRPLLLPPSAASSCTKPPASAQAEIRSVTLYPYRLHLAHPDVLLEPLCAYIQDHYKEQQPATAEHFGYAVWVPLVPAPATHNPVLP